MLCLSGFELHSRWVPLTFKRFEDENEIWLQGPPSFPPLQKKKHPEKLHCNFFFTRKVCTVNFNERGLKVSLDRKMIKLVTFDNLLPPLRHSRIKLVVE